ncbi:MAG TPA: VWA domain-containing protein [Vicinamibacteria bacterium]|nr:VWA domain-containing protein [Vicinamibacteria bacterium]
MSLCAASAATGGPAQQTPPLTFREKVEVVSVDVLVLNQLGNPASGLTQPEFTVKEDGVVQTITSFEAIRFEESEASEAERERFVSNNTVERVRPERAFLVIYDDTHLTTLGARLAESEFAKLVDGLAPGDVVSALATSSKSWWTARLPEGRDELLNWARGIKGLKPMDTTAGRISDWEAMQIYYGRDPSILGMVARRYFENGLIAEMPPPPNERQSRRETDVAYGLPLIRAKATQVYDEAARAAVASLEVIKRAVAALGTQRGRKAVLVLSEGFFHDTTRTELRELVTAARQANAVLYFFDARGRSGPNAPDSQAENWRILEERDRALTAANFARDAEGTESAAYDTGGRVVKGTDDLASAMLQVVSESRTYYLLGYVSSNPKRDGKFRKIEVSVARPDLEVRARKGYYAPRDKDENKPRPADALDPQVRAGLDSPFDSDTIPMRMASYVLGRAASGKASVLLVADLDLRGVSFEGKGGRQVGALESFALVSPLTGGGSEIVEKRIDLSLPPDLHARVLKAGLPILRDFELASGRYQARLLVRDARGGAVGTVRHTFEVPSADGFHISTPILSDTLTSGAGGAEVPMPLAHRRFTSGSRVFYVFDVYGATRGSRGTSEVAIGYVVRRKDGSVLAESGDRTVAGGEDGSSSHRLVLPLTGVSPGEYELLLTVEDRVNGNRLERRDVFFVDAT